MKILAIETSCDETAAAVIEANRLPLTATRRDITIDNFPKADSGQRTAECRILSNVVASQIKIHQKYGGVFPEMASRAHTEKIIPVVEEALGKIKPNVIAITVGPGLIGSLLIGVNFAKTYAYIKNLPIVGINHLFGHLYSNWANEPLPEFPAVILIVSGGHTGLYLMKNHTDIKTLGETLDDAAGEAFDKVAKMLRLGYPGGPAISKTATKCHSERSEESPANAGSRTNREILHCVQDDNIKFPRSMLNSGDYNFSFSGLKTAVLYKVQELAKHYTLNATRSQIAYEFQQAVIDILVGKTIQAALEFRPKSIYLCGGVSANQELRQQLKLAVNKLPFRTSYHIPPMNLTTDNAAMIGLAAAYHLDQKTTWDKINAKANLKL